MFLNINNTWQPVLETVCRILPQDGDLQVRFAMRFACPFTVDRSADPVTTNPFSNTNIDQLVVALRQRRQLGCRGNVDLSFVFEGAVAHMPQVVERYCYAVDWPWPDPDQTLAAIVRLNNCTEDGYWALLDEASKSAGRVRVSGAVTPVSLPGTIIILPNVAYRGLGSPRFCEWSEDVERRIAYPGGAPVGRHSFAGILDEWQWLESTAKLTLPSTQAEYSALLTSASRSWGLKSAKYEAVRHLRRVSLWLRTAYGWA